jgi:predicted RNA-binding protein with PIN domain
VRKARNDAERAVKAVERRADQLAAQVDELTGRVKALEKETAAAHKETSAVRAEAEREVRKARRRADQAERAAKDARKELHAANAEIKKQAGARAPAKPPPKKRASPRAPKPPAKRSPLPAPKGRLAEAPETLEEWLQADQVHLLIDGYNVSKARGGFGDLSLETQRRRLMQEVGKLVRRSGASATIVFDGSEIAPGTSRRARAPVAVEYSRPHEIADDHLIAKLEDLPNFPVIVVTNDRELQDRAAARGATIARSDQLLALIR